MSKKSIKQADRIKKSLAVYGRKIAHRHLVMGAMGNISAREAKVVWIKRGGSWLVRAKPEDFIAVNIKTAKAKSGQLPSKEVFLHLNCYRVRPDIKAVVHTHPVTATALASAGISLDRSSKRLASLLGSKTCALRYYSPGSKKLACEVRRAIKKANAVVLANHGLVTVGRNIKQAYERSLACEDEAKRILTFLL